MENNRKSEAVRIFLNGYNCCQAVVLAYEDLIVQMNPGMTREALARLGNMFGSGVAGTGEVCGAFNGLCMVLGLVSDIPTDDRMARMPIYRDIQGMSDAFAEKFKSVRCRDILKNFGPDPYFDDDEELAEIYAKRPCAKCVAYAVDMIEEYLNK